MYAKYKTAVNALDKTITFYFAQLKCMCKKSLIGRLDLAHYIS